MFESYLTGQPATPLDFSVPGVHVRAFDCQPPHPPLVPSLSKGHFEALFCRSGGVELILDDRRQLLLQNRQILLLSDPSQIRSAQLSPRQFQGILISVDSSAARESLTQFCALLGGVVLDLHKIALLMQEQQGCSAVRESVWSEAVFDTIEQLPIGEQGRYCILKSVELLYLLCVGSPLLSSPTQGYFDRYQLETVRLVQQYLLEHLDEPLTIEQLARQFHISSTLLKSCFRSQFGKPLHRYLQGLRMERAAQLLEGSGLSISQIASSVGYNSVSQFGALFKRTFQCTPLAYRKQKKRLVT